MFILHECGNKIHIPIYMLATIDDHNLAAGICVFMKNNIQRYIKYLK